MVVEVNPERETVPSRVAASPAGGDIVEWFGLTPRKNKERVNIYMKNKYIV